MQYLVFVTQILKFEKNGEKWGLKFPVILKKLQSDQR